MALASLSSSRALAYLTERGEDALYAVKGMLGGTGSSRYLDTGEDKLAVVQAQLESSQDVERLEGLKRVVAMISKGRDATPYLASVFKLSSSTSLEIRKLVYIIVLRYAPAHPDLALLSINSFQRDLSDPNPLIRGMALRALIGLRLKVVSAIVVLAVSKATRDAHPYVRRIAAFSLPTCYHLDDSQFDTLLAHLGTFLQDRSPLVLGPALLSFAELCPDHWSLLHRHFRKLCHALVDMDEWSQPTCVQVLVRYARANLPKPEPGVDVDPDLALLQSALATLLTHVNPAVVLASIHALVAVTHTSDMKRVIPPLLHLLQGPPDVAYMAIMNVLAMTESQADDFAPHLLQFLVGAADPAYLARLKIRVLVRLATDTSASLLVQELATYAQAEAESVATDSITALGQVACRYNAVASQGLQLLMDVAQDSSLPSRTLSRTVQVIKTLLRVSSDAEAAKIIARFSLRLFVPLAQRGRPADAPRLRILLDPESRSAVLWMLGQYCLAPLAEETLLTCLVPDMLRCLVAHWAKEPRKVQCQALTLSSKAFVYLDSVKDTAIRTAITVLHYELLSRGLSSKDSDVRDRARFYSGLTRGLFQDDELAGDTLPEEIHAYLVSHRDLDRFRLPGVRLRLAQAQHVLFARDLSETSPLEQLSLTSMSTDELASMSSVTAGVHLVGWRQAQLPPWSEPEARPPSIVRMPEPGSLKPHTSVNTQRPSGAWLEEQRSFGSDMVQRGAPHAERVVLEPHTTATRARTVPQARARYEDLNAFLEAESIASESDAASLDDPAAEDEEYLVESSSSSGLDDDL
ncbi:AP-3 complex subunit beta [Malassezia caprae]|uniref:AP-3 complex subunit beta n=1 Tax=Malassezia caprae TaxID=1381934 RepID=A0AAF0IUN5_9BASI|nr:AP-3 complex subunit beta [Malassezia caprae]